MLRFAVFDDGGPARNWPMHDVVLLGKGDVVVPGTVRFDSSTGHIECEPAESGAVGLGLLHQAGAAGTLALKTGLLPYSSEPYILTVELARRAIGQFLTKTEEWQMAYLGEELPAFEHWESSRRGFTKAMVSTDAHDAHTRAQKALEMAVDASERLVVAHAEILLRRRYAKAGASSTAIGCRVSLDRCVDGLKDVLAKQFGLVVLPITWKALCPQQGEYNWAKADAWMEWAQDHRRRVVVGPLIDLEHGQLPHWTADLGDDYLALRDAAYEHVERVVQRYGDSVGMWNLVSGMEMGTSAVGTEREMVDLVRTLSLLVRSDNRGRRIVVEVARPWGHYRAEHPDAPAPIHFISRLAQSGIRLDAIGIRLLMGGSQGCAVRDLMDICTLLDRLMSLEVPVLLTACAVPDGPVEGGRGVWRKGWSPKLQATWASILPQVALARPCIESFVWGDLYDTPDAQPSGAGLISAEGRAKPALQRLSQVARLLKKSLSLESDGSAP